LSVIELIAMRWRLAYQPMNCPGLPLTP